jgi:nucleotide-binding universal stress UspA family protein
MEFKSVTVPFLGHDDELAALKTALNLTSHNKARLEVLHVMPDPSGDAWLYAMGYMLSPYDPSEAVSQIAHLWPEMRDIAESKFREAAKEAKINIESESDTVESPSAYFFGTTGSLEKLVGRRSRTSDLVIMTRPPGRGDSGFKEAAYGALFGSGRPVLFVPPGKVAHHVRERAIIAWDGSAEAARAVALALPMLKHTKIWIFTAHGPGKGEFPVSAKALARYLSGHSISADLLEPEVAPQDIAEILEKSAKTLDVGMVVMGAYSHNRIRETIFGGLTDTMLNQAQIPVLMAH